MSNELTIADVMKMIVVLGCMIAAFYVENL